MTGCTQFQVFYKVILPLSKPIVVYTILTAFLDFVFVKVIVGPNDKYWTVSLLLYNMLEKEFVNGWFTRWAAALLCGGFWFILGCGKLSTFRLWGAGVAHSGSSYFSSEHTVYHPAWRVLCAKFVAALWKM